MWVMMIVFFLFGLVVGSFTNVLIWRLPRGESIIFPPSHCPNCDNKIKFYDNIPVISYVILGGKCRSCRQPIPIRYPLVELMVGGLFLFTYLKFDFSHPFKLAGGLFLSFTLLAIMIIDFQHFIIPDMLSIGGLAVGLFLAHWILDGKYPELNSLAGAVGAGFIFYTLSIIGEKLFNREALGGGDIKLIAFLGAFLGWQKILLTIFLSALIATLVAVSIMPFSKKLREERLIPFGPFIALSGWVIYYWGDKALNLYFSILGV